MFYGIFNIFSSIERICFCWKFEKQQEFKKDAPLLHSGLSSIPKGTRYSTQILLDTRPQKISYK